MGLTKLWIINNSKIDSEVTGNRTTLNKYGINFLEGEVTEINLTEHNVRVGKQSVRYDYLVIALGADYSTTSTPGFANYAKNLYTESGCAEIRDILRSFRGGTVNIVVCGLPFKCPPAPYEASMIIDDVLRKNGVREKVKLRLITPEAHPLTILGPEAGKIVTRLLEDRQIEYNPQQKVAEIQRNMVVTESAKFQHDLVLAIPVHVAPSVLKESGLIDQTGWVPVNPATMATKIERVYAIGDNAGIKVLKGLLLPRAGVLAEGQGKVVGENILREIQGQKMTETFNGEGVCFMEVGDGQAAPLNANFYAQPAPKWEFIPPSKEGFQQKRQFLTERMRAWFG
jgi:sulfide:quinone oxidoreductase